MSHQHCTFHGRYAVRPLVVAMLLLLALPVGCSATSEAPAAGRAYRGGVHIVLDGGTRREALAMAADHPQLALSSQFHLRVAGQLGAAHYAMQVTLDPMVEGQRYEFPRDGDQLQLAMQRDAAELRLGPATGFLLLQARDDEQQLGAAICSLALRDAGGFAVAELDLTFERIPRADPAQP